jgi:hypothetical protein
MAEPTEDIPYEVSAISLLRTKKPKGADVDQPNKSVLVEVSKELEKDIARNNLLMLFITG